MTDVLPAALCFCCCCVLFAAPRESARPVQRGCHGQVERPPLPTQPRQRVAGNQQARSAGTGRRQARRLLARCPHACQQHGLQGVRTCQPCPRVEAERRRMVTRRQHGPAHARPRRHSPHGSHGTHGPFGPDRRYAPPRCSGLTHPEMCFSPTASGFRFYPFLGSSKEDGRFHARVAYRHIDGSTCSEVFNTLLGPSVVLQ